MKRVREKGVVVEVRGKTALVRLTPNDPKACGECCACSFGDGGERSAEVPAPDGIRVGDEVHLEISPPSKYLGVLLFFVLPLVLLGAGFAAGYFAGRALCGEERGAGYLAVLGGAAGLAASYFAVRILDRTFIGRRSTPRIVGRPE